MNDCVFVTQKEEDTRELAGRLASLLQAGDILALEGDLGAGKTTFTQGIARGLGVIESVDSPTFAIIKEYTGDLPLYHMDAYRLETSGEELGLDEYLYGSGICVVEWPSRMKDILPKEIIRLSFQLKDDGSREITITPPSCRNDICKGLSR